MKWIPPSISGLPRHRCRKARVEKAAARFGISVSELADYLDGTICLSEGILRFVTPRKRISAKRGRPMREAEMTRYCENGCRATGGSGRIRIT